MRSAGVLAVVVGGLGGALLLQNAGAQAPPAANAKSGPGVQATRDPKEADLLKTCKTPPPAPAARGGGAPKGGPGGPGGGARGAKGGPGGAGGQAPRDYTVTEIPGVIAAGAKWTEVWTGEGNNSDGIIATSDGGILIAQNDNSDVLKLDKDGKTSVAYSGLNTSGSVAMSSKGALFVVNRGLNMSIEQLAPKRRVLANKMPNGDPIDCAGGGVLNDLTADSKGGVYFTMGSVYHADAKGVITKYGQNLFTNGIMLSPDEKHLWVTNNGTLAEFDVQKDGSLTNQHEFAKLAGGGDGSTFDAAGRMYVTDSAGIEVISPEGKVLGAIPTPRGVITVTFSGPDRKTLYAVSNDQRNDHIMTIPMIAQGPKGRGK